MTTGSPTEAPTAPPLPPPPPAPQPAAGGASTSSERTYATLTHLSTFLSLLVAGLFFLGPLVMWLVKKDESACCDHHGKEAVNFHLTMFLAHCGMAVLTFVTCGVGAVLWPLLGIWHVIWPIVAAVRANDGVAYRYPLTLRLLS
jgi:uncharacterized Tic20 family protein